MSNERRFSTDEYTPLLYTSSLPSVLMAADPNGSGLGALLSPEIGTFGTALGTDDEERLLILSDQRSLDEGQTSNRFLLPGGATSGDDPEAARSADYGHLRTRRRRQHRRGASKRPPKQRRRRIHSDTDLRKMRPLIIAPFMRTFGTQVSVNAGGSAQQQQHQTIGGHHHLPHHERSRGGRCLTGTSAGGTVAVPGFMPTVPMPVATTAIPTPVTRHPSQHVKYGSMPSSTPTKPTEEELTKADEKLQKKGEEEESSESDEEDEDEEESSSDEEESSSESSYTRFSELSHKQKATIAILAIVNFFSTVAFSCIAPFFPAEAEMKGLGTSEIGLVFGVFELVMFFTCPLIGKYMAVLGSKRVFTVGVFVTGITAILFGFLNLLPSGKTFFWAALLIRCAEALGDACFVTSSFAISAKSFPGRIGTVVGIMETFAGLGFTAGPMVGSVLYEYGGFQTPFFALGMCLIVVNIISYYIIDEIEDDPSDDAMGMREMLKIPVIWLMVFAVIVCAMSLSFFDPTLAGHLASFNLSTTMIGFMFLLCGGFYFITAPLWGLLLDRWRTICEALMLFGAAATIVALLMVGPSPMLAIEKNLFLIGASLAVLGVAAGALYIPIFQSCLDAVKENGFDDSFQTYGCVSGVFQSAWAFGAFVGPTLGGLAVESIGFPVTTTIIACINVVFVIALSLHMVYMRTGDRRRTRSTPSSSSSTENNNNPAVSSPTTSSSSSSTPARKAQEKQKANGAEKPLL